MEAWCWCGREVSKGRLESEATVHEASDACVIVCQPPILLVVKVVQVSSGCLRPRSSLAGGSSAGAWEVAAGGGGGHVANSNCNAIEQHDDDDDGDDDDDDDDGDGDGDGDDDDDDDDDGGDDDDDGERR